MHLFTSGGAHRLHIQAAIWLYIAKLGAAAAAPRVPRRGVCCCCWLARAAAPSYAWPGGQLATGRNYSCCRCRRCHALGPDLGRRQGIRSYWSRPATVCHVPRQLSRYRTQKHWIQAQKSNGGRLGPSCFRYEGMVVRPTTLPGFEVNLQSCIVQMECGHGTQHKDVVEHYRQSRFCPLISGDFAATWRLPEVILAGCIPVFLFPPLHTAPLPLDVDWKTIGIFINITREANDWYDDER